MIQIDSVNVVARSQDLVLFSRLGAHPPGLVPDATEAGELFEYWVHEASHVPAAHHHLHRWHMERVAAAPWRRAAALEDARPGFIDEVLARLADGPMVAGDLAQRIGPKGTWWDWDDGKVALEHLFWTGQAVASRRRSDFARIYDLPHRRLPADVLSRPSVPEHEARKQLLELAARHHGIATLNDLTDYHRQRNPPCKPLIDELVAEGRLVEVDVPGWTHQAYLHPQARIPRRVGARALLSPFDPVVWNRDRAERLFGFRYRIEIYVPAAKRVHGYYVLPFLLGDRIVARVDLKADRREGRLLVQSAFAEPGVDVIEVAAELATELGEMATWLGLGEIVVAERGDLAGLLRRAVPAAIGVPRSPPSPPSRLASSMPSAGAGRGG